MSMRATRHSGLARSRAGRMTHRVMRVYVLFHGARARWEKPRLIIETFCGVPSAAVGSAQLVDGPDELHPTCPACDRKAS
jgi:hypothetical protein